jgi:outer membrane protein assembly factor BamB
MGLLAGILLPVVSAIPVQAAEPTNWPQVGFDATRRSFNPFETILDPSNVSGLHQLWGIDVGGEQTTPIVADGTVFTISYENGSLTAVDAATGVADWRFTIGDHTWLAEPAVAGGRVYTGAGDLLRFYALDETTGDLLWKIPISGATLPPAVVEGDPDPTVYVAAGDTLYAIDGATGSVLWSQEPTPVEGLSGAPAVADGVVYQPDQEGTLHAYAADGGTELWSVRLANDPLEGVTVDGSRVFVVGLRGQLWALDAPTGAVLWKRFVSVDSTPSVANGIVYVYSRRDPPIYLTAFREDTGELLWRGELGSGRLYGYPNGPSIANGVVYAGSLAGALVAFDATDGTRLWDYRTHKNVLGSPVVVDGKVYATAMGHLMSFGLSGMPEDGG